jgi:hypothetical protein
VSMEFPRIFSISSLSGCQSCPGHYFQVNPSAARCRTIFTFCDHRMVDPELSKTVRDSDFEAHRLTLKKFLSWFQKRILSKNRTMM